MRRLPLALLAVLAACTTPTPSAGSSVQPPAPPTTSRPDAGRVDVGGYELAYECRGHGSPTIVTEAGYDSAGTSVFFDLMDPLARVSRVCAYDRAGTGVSQPRPSAPGLTVMDQAAELHALLEGAGIGPPYVLVAHSFGGFVSRLFASAYPNEASGLLLIESSHEDEIEAYRRVYREDPRRADWVDGGDLLDIDATAQVLRRQAHDLGALPVIAMRAERYEDDLTRSLWRRTQADLAAISTDSIHVVALGSGHAVMESNLPAILEAVSGLVAAARAGEPLATCEDVFRTSEVECVSS